MPDLPQCCASSLRVLLSSVPRRTQKHTLAQKIEKKFYSQIASKVYREITHTSASYFSSFVRLYMFVYSLSLLRRCSQILLFSHSNEIEREYERERKTWHCT